MRTDFERRLSDSLHELTPEPPGRYARDEQERIGLLIIHRRLWRGRRGFERLARWPGAACAGLGSGRRDRRRSIIRTTQRNGHQSRRRASHILLVLHH